MDSVVQLVNKLQSAATKLGDNAASDGSLPSLWSLLPSIVVIGGQVPSSSSLILAKLVTRSDCLRHTPVNWAAAYEVQLSGLSASPTQQTYLTGHDLGSAQLLSASTQNLGKGSAAAHIHHSPDMTQR